MDPIPGNEDLGVWKQDLGVWKRGANPWKQDLGVWKQDLGVWKQDLGVWKLGDPQLTKTCFFQDGFAWSGKRSQTPWEYFAAYQGSPAAI